jgi:hypothetical protein
VLGVDTLLAIAEDARWRAGATNVVAADRALPLYIRDKVAQTTEERAAARAVPSSP